MAGSVDGVDPGQEKGSTPPRDLEELYRTVLPLLAELDRTVKLQTERLNNQEAMLASLTMAYVEMFAAVDMVIKTTIADYSPEDQEKFLKQFDEFRANVLKSIQEASRSGVEGLDPDTQRAVENMAKRSRDSNI